MKKLSKKQRHEIYKNCLNEHLKLDHYNYMFLCNEISRQSNIKLFYLGSIFHEFFMFIPEDACLGEAWFNGIYESKEVKEHQRVILQLCIEMTK